MNDFKSVQDLIVKAAMYDGVTTTISKTKMFGGRDALRITFSKDDKYSTTYINMEYEYRNPEEAALYSCKDALHRLIWGRYDEIKVKENNYEM